MTQHSEVKPSRLEQLIRRFRRREAISLLLLTRFLPDRSGAPQVPPPWQESGREIPADLLTYPGEIRDPEEEDSASADQPLNDFFSVHPEASEFIVSHGLGFLVPTFPRVARAVHRIRQATRLRPSRRQKTHSPETLTALIRDEARRIGLSRIGIAATDERYTFDVTDAEQLPTVIVCLLEQDWDLTQKIPSDEAEQAAFFGYAEGMERTAKLAEFLKGLGYRAAPQGLTGDGIAIHYAIEAGLGQLGINGQLLTPEAGSRCRILMLTTDATLTLDEPVDYGLHKVCDECQACVRNCPVGAIPKARKPFRGVVKSKLNTARCLPLVAQAGGCAICMKVCPVQRYGLDAILDHREKTGEILGLGSDELEGYDWPLDDRHYGPGETPRVGEDLVSNPDLTFDIKRTRPLAGTEPIRFVGPKRSQR
jgi:epoxyqueuosine reductase